MDAALRVVTRLPLEQLWRDSGVVITSRRRALTVDDITQLLSFGTVEFVVADVGKKLRWLDPTNCSDFWKIEARPHLATEGSRMVLDDFPGFYCYRASEWESDLTATPIVLLEHHH